MDQLSGDITPPSPWADPPLLKGPPMRTLKIISVAMLAACALSVTVVAPASAHTFLASATDALILDSQLTSQLFRTDAGTIECTKETSHGITTAIESLTQIETFTYSGCKGFGSNIATTKAEYELSADETVNILNTIVITSSLGCSVKISPTGNQNLKTILYKNNNNNLIIKAEVKNLSYSSSGGACGPTGALTNGEYTGESEATLDGSGKLAWD